MKINVSHWILIKIFTAFTFQIFPTQKFMCMFAGLKTMKNL